MRKTKRFTPTVIARFLREGRGNGTHEDYIPWHRVSRGDPSSRGRSHLLLWRSRLRELLSDGELGAQLFATMLPDLDDSLEQFLLSIEDSAHPIAAYGENCGSAVFPGTERLASELGIRHPRVTGNGSSAKWRATTDLLLVFKQAGLPRSMLAVAFKPIDWGGKARERELLRLEREYWVRRQVPWLLVTPTLYDQRTVLTLRRVSCWGLAEDVAAADVALAAQIAEAQVSSSLTQVLHQIAERVGTLEVAQRALWRSVWSGRLRVDLRMGWRPHAPLRHISLKAFTALNPIASRRTAWI